MAIASLCPLPGDTGDELLAKILTALGMADPTNQFVQGDLTVDILRKILNKLNAQSIGVGPQTPWKNGDSEYLIWKKILLKLGGGSC